MTKDKGRENCQAQESFQNTDSPKKNHLYDLKSIGDQEISSDVVIGMYLSLYFMVLSSFMLIIMFVISYVPSQCYACFCSIFVGRY